MNVVDMGVVIKMQHVFVTKDGLQSIVHQALARTIVQEKAHA
jgi:hypothetical protein